MGSFNNRELATAFWLLVFAIWALRRTEIRKSLGGVFRAFWRFKIVVSVSLMLLYVSGVVAFLAVIAVWNVNLLKDTILWFLFGAMAMMMRFVTANDTDNTFRKILTDNIKIVILLEFLANTYTFPLAVELVLVPLLTFVAMIDVVAGAKEEHAIVSKAAKGILITAGFVILGFAVSRAFADFHNLKSLDTLRSVALAPLLSALLFPFIYIILVISKYELIFVLTRETPRSLKRYARRQIMKHAGFSLRRLQCFLRNHMVDLMHIDRESDVDGFFRQARSGEAQEGEE